MKQLRLRYASRCGGCGIRLPKGAIAWWAHGQKPLCPNCHSAGKQSVPSPVATASPATAKPKSHKYFNDFVIEWPEAKRLLAAVVKSNGQDRQGLTDRQFNYLWADIKGDSDGTSWYGFTRGDIIDWLTTGYQTTAIQGLAGMVPAFRRKRRTRYTEDGDELHVDRAISGEDNFMSVATKREVIPGVKLNIELDASAGSSQALFAYQQWIARTIYALESSGIGCEVDIYTLSRGLFNENNGIVRTAVRVKQEDEIADYAEFSAMFSPAAFRGIMFALFSVQANREGMTQMGHGSGVTDSWSVNWHPDTRSIEIRCDWNAHTFPEESMTAQFKTALTEMRENPAA